MTKLNCRVGDLAIVVSAENVENLGNLIEVVGLKDKQGPNVEGPGHVWHVRTVSGRATLTYRYKTEGGRIEHHAEGPVPDVRLRPVSGLADDDAVREDVAVKKAAPRRLCGLRGAMQPIGAPAATA